VDECKPLHTGDHRQFYRVDTTVEIPDAIIPPEYAEKRHPHGGAGGGGALTVRVRYPAVAGPALTLNPKP
jgi:hypothetical protein